MLLDQRAEFAQPRAWTADPADGQVCGEAAMFLGKAQRFQCALQGRMQLAQRFAALARAQPQRPRPAGAGKRACPANLQIERLAALAAAFCTAALTWGIEFSGTSSRNFNVRCRLCGWTQETLAPVAAKIPISSAARCRTAALVSTATKVRTVFFMVINGWPAKLRKLFELFRYGSLNDLARFWGNASTTRKQGDVRFPKSFDP